MKSEYKKIPKFKNWLQEQGMTQDSLAHQTHLSVRTVHKLVNTGIANDSTILLVAHVLEIDEKELISMLITQENKAYFDKRAK
jgi:hypothetical protein